MILYMMIVQSAVNHVLYYNNLNFNDDLKKTETDVNRNRNRKDVNNYLFFVYRIVLVLL